MITTISESQTAILRDIEILYNRGRPFQADLTYGHGGFWKHTIPPALRGDLDPDLPGLTHPGLDVRDLPFESDSLVSVVFDPPFIHAPGKESVMGKQFGGFKSQAALFQMYKESAEEIRRVLAPGGLLVWKCQDIVESGKQVWNHIRIIDWCQDTTTEPFQADVTSGGFRLEDLFILVNPNRPIGHNHAIQKHARKTHSYFLVFRRTNSHRGT